MISLGFYSDNDTNSPMDSHSILSVLKNSTNGHSHTNGHLSDDNNGYPDSNSKTGFDQQTPNGIDGDLINKIKIQNQFYSLDSITPDLISKMNKIEKEVYINKCRQLFTAIYELWRIFSIFHFFYYFFYGKKSCLILHSFIIFSFELGNFGITQVWLFVNVVVVVVVVSESELFLLYFSTI